MYSKQIPFKDFNKKPRNAMVHFNLTEREVFKLLGELQALFAWKDSVSKGAERILETEEVVEFYNNFEHVLLEAWGEPSADGLHFRKGNKYDFEESALFNACMVLFVTDVGEATKLLDAIMPEGLEELVRKADESLIEAAKNSDNPDLKAEVERLRAELAAATGGAA